MFKNNFKKIFGILFLGIVTLGIFGLALIINAEDEAGKIELTKRATKIKVGNDDNLEYGRMAKVMLTVKGNPYMTSEIVFDKLDVVLVLDSSGSMDEKASSDKNALKRIQVLKDTATDFINTLIYDPTKSDSTVDPNNTRIAIIDFDTKIQNMVPLTNDKEKLLDAVDKLEAEGGTNTQAGISKADELLNNARDDAKQVVIILTDGIPTYFNYNGSRYGEGDSDDSVCVESNGRKCTLSMRPSDAAKNTLDDLKKKHEQTDVYTITFGNAKNALSTLAKINPPTVEDATPKYINYESLTGEELKNLFKTIIDELKNVVGKDSVVTDIIPKEFKLEEESKQNLISLGIKVVENNDGSTMLTWNIGDIDGDKANTLTYNVIAKDEYHGSIFTNEKAKLKTTVGDTNPYYQDIADKTLELEFEKPTVEIPAITNDDHYNDNASYIGIAGMPINGSSILTNDLNKIVSTDKLHDKFNVAVNDKIIVVETENVVKDGDNTYNIFNNGNKQGTLVINKDGSFVFTAGEDVTGEVMFDYYIESVITGFHEAEKVYSNTSTVTLKINARERTNLSGKKVWNDQDNNDGLRPESVKIALYDGKKLIEEKEITGFDNEWTYEFDDLPVYQLGHEYEENYKINYTVKETSIVNGYVSSSDGKNITNTHNIIKNKKIDVQKIWNDNDNQDGKRPESVLVELMRDGVKTDLVLTLNETNNWSGSFENLQVYENKKEIVYTVDEKVVPTSYIKNISKNETGYVITNEHKMETIDIPFKKIWDDSNDNDSIRPDKIKIGLTGKIKNDEIDKTVVVKNIEVGEQTNWTYTFENLPKYWRGKEIIYEVEEEKVSGYETIVNGFDITNKHEILKDVEVTVNKIWDDNNNQDGYRPKEVEVKVIGTNGYEEKAVLNEENNWTHIFRGLQRYDNKKEICYEVVETTKLNKYETPIITKEGNHFVITNKHNIEKRDVSVEKVWDDNNNQDGIRPKEIKVILNKTVADTTTKVKEAIITPDTLGNWKYVFRNLDKFENQQEILYSVEEVQINKYITEIVRNNEMSYVITNTHASEKVNISGKKTWDDNNNQDGIRPEKITVILKSNEQEIRRVDVTEKSNWEYVFTDLDKYNDGKMILYTIEEESVKGYKATYNGNNIKNTHKPAKIEISGKKIWQDANNAEGIRPEKVTVILKANGEEIKKIDVYEKNNWEYKFTDLDKFANGRLIHYYVEEVPIKDYKTSYGEGENRFLVYNTYDVNNYSISGEKIWDDEDNIYGRPDEVTVILTGRVKDKVIVGPLNKKVTKDNNWKYKFDNLAKYYQGEKIVYTIDEEDVLDYTKEVTGFNVINKYTPEKRTISGVKTWDDDDNRDGIRPTEITVTLIGRVNDEIVVGPINRTVTEKDMWNYKFSDLDKYANGLEINYEITENSVEGYVPQYNGFNITNVHKIGTKNISVVKTWDDNNNQDGIRPEKITVILEANGLEVKRADITNETNWQYTFTNLLEKENMQDIVYTVKEVNVNGYVSEYDGYNIKNIHQVEKTEISVMKTWDDNNNQDGKRPTEIMVSLTGKVDDKDVCNQTVKLSEETGWQYTFMNLDKNYNGKLIEYTIKENPVEDYKTTITRNGNNFTINNKYKPIKISIKGKKEWIDANNAEGIRPDQITIRLFNKDKEVANTITSKESNWEYVFTDLDKFENGREISYSVVEDAVENYRTSYDSENKFIIVNTYDTNNYEVVGTKTWIDTDNVYGRPAAITIVLTGKVGGDTVVGPIEKTVSAEDKWQYSFNNLPRYYEGKLIYYEIDEKNVLDYTKSIDGYNITNKYTPETFSIEGSKVWDDDDDRDGIRPDSIKINLYANEKLVSTTEASAKSNWTYRFDDLVKYANGIAISYTIEEVDVDGYTKSIDGYKFTNHHLPATVSYNVSKVWDDANNNDAIRPNSITVRLLADGYEISKQAITKENNWTYLFKDLPKYRDGGIEIKYSIIEDVVKGYISDINSIIEENSNVIIINKHEKETEKITITKIWDDLNNKYNTRPDKIKVVITGEVDGKTILTKEVEVTKAMNWVYKVEDLDKYYNGKLITYKIVEKEAEGYKTSYDGFKIINKLIQPGSTEGEEIPNTGANAKIKDKNIFTNFALLVTLIMTTLGLSILLILKKKRKYF